MKTSRSMRRVGKPAKQRQRIKVRNSFDLLLKNGRVVDPANGIDDIRDIAIKEDKIVAVEPDIGDSRASRVCDVSGLLVLPGLIDLHAHIFEHVSGHFGLNPDAVGIRSGVTTLVDQGAASALTINGFRRFIVDNSDTDVLCFISAYLAGGLGGHRYVNLYGPEQMDVDAVVAEGRSNRDIVRGIKVHAEVGGFSRWGTEALKLAKIASRKLEIPIYVHLGQLWREEDGTEIDPDDIIDQLIPLLDEGDILAHPYTRNPSGFVSPQGEVHPMIFKALERGVRIDVGRGSHFSFEAAKALTKAGIKPNTLGIDLHGFNVGKTFKYEGKWRSAEFDYDYGSTVTRTRFNPTFCIYTAMSEMLALGFSDVDVIKMVTTNAADVLKTDNVMGSLGVRRRADVTVVALQKGKFTLQDGGILTDGDLGPEKDRVTLAASKRFRPAFALHKGKIVELDSPLLPKSEKPTRSMLNAVRLAA